MRMLNADLLRADLLNADRYLMQRRLVVVLVPIDDSKSTFETRQLKKVVLVLDGTP